MRANRTSRPPSWPPSRRRRGVLLYISMALMSALAVLAYMLDFQARAANVNAIFVYHSEVITNLAEAAVEEVFHNFEDKLNDPDGNNELYDALRAPWDPADSAASIPIEAETMIEYAAAARALGEETYGIKPEHFVVTGQITDIDSFEVRGMNPPDRIEKSAKIEVAVTITLSKQTKTVVASRPVKVVRTTMPVLAESTFFLNNMAADNFAHWPSAMGYDPENVPEPQKSIVLDHGWAKYQKTNKKSDFLKALQDQIFPTGAVPPGRVFINKGIVPLTNGDRAAGALQKTFFSAESELLPVLPKIPLARLKEGLQEDHIQATERERAAQLAREREEGVEIERPVSAPPTESTSATDPSSSVPEEGDLIVRYLGHGMELVTEDMTGILGDKAGDGYRQYFDALVEGPWADDPPTKSGLDLFGRTVEKKKGEALKEERGGLLGLWDKVVDTVKSAASKLLSKLYAKYNIKLSPTLVYGNVLQSYFMVRDYAFGDWAEKIKRTFGDKQIPIPYFPEGHLDRFPEDTPLTEENLPDAWDDEFKERFMGLPDEIRRPGFIKTLDSWASGITDKIGPVLPDDLREKVESLPQGSIVAPYHQALRAFLQPPPDSGFDQWAEAYRQAASKVAAPGGGLFLTNEVDRDALAINGAYEKFFEGNLSQFNPFLFYVKATEYVSSLWDARMPRDAPDSARNVFLRKFRDEEDAGLLRLNGVIYITGTEELVLANFRYTGKAILITFGEVRFDGFFRKNNDDPDEPEKNDLLTIISLGGIKFNTTEPVHAQLYSYIYPYQVAPGETMNVFGGIGANDMPLRLMGDGANVNYDWTYHIPREEIDEGSADAIHYYHVSITDEISKFEYQITRELAPEIDPNG